MYLTHEEINEAYRAGHITKCTKQQAHRRLKKRLLKVSRTGKSSYKTSVQRAKEIKRLPFWVDRPAIREVYRNCPKEMSVDHIIPLSGELASGLHTAENLQYLDKKANRRKGNSFTPYIEVNPNRNWWTRTEIWRSLRKTEKHLKKTTVLLWTLMKLRRV